MVLCWNDGEPALGSMRVTKNGGGGGAGGRRGSLRALDLRYKYEEVHAERTGLPSAR